MVEFRGLVQVQTHTPENKPTGHRTNTFTHKYNPEQAATKRPTRCSFGGSCNMQVILFNGPAAGLSDGFNGDVN